MDVTKAADIDAAVRAMEGEMRAAGGLFALVNNGAHAGVSRARYAPVTASLAAGVCRGYLFDWTPLSDYRAVMEVNYFGALGVTQALLPHLKAARGRVINVSSVAGLLAVPAMTAYTASKHALQAWSDGLRAEMASFGVQVSSVNPSFHRTAILTQFGPHLRRLWAALAPAHRAQYGDEVMARCEAELATVTGASANPANVVAVIEGLVVRDGRLPTRVRVGLDPPGLLSYLPWHALYAPLIGFRGLYNATRPDLAREQYAAAGKVKGQ